jgi:hypothetical protein
VTRHLPPPTRYGSAGLQRAAAPAARAFPPPPPTRYGPQSALRRAASPAAPAALNALHTKRLVAPPPGHAPHVLQKMDTNSFKQFDDFLARRKTPELPEAVVVIDMADIFREAATNASSKQVAFDQYGLTMKFERSDAAITVSATHLGATGECYGRWYNEAQKIFGIENIVARGMLAGAGTLLFGAFVYYCLSAPEPPKYFGLASKNEAMGFWGKYELQEIPQTAINPKAYARPASAVKAKVDQFQQVPLRPHREKTGKK